NHLPSSGVSINMKHRLFNAVAILSATLLIAVCMFWVRSRSGWDRAWWMWCRYLPDKSIVSDEVCLVSSRQGGELSIMHGHAPPRPVDLVRGYDINADESGGRPRFFLEHARYDALDNWAYARTPKVFNWPIRFGMSSEHTPKDIANRWRIGLTIS